MGPKNRSSHLRVPSTDLRESSNRFVADPCPQRIFCHAGVLGGVVSASLTLACLSDPSTSTEATTADTTQTAGPELTTDASTTSDTASSSDTGSESDTDVASESDSDTGEVMPLPSGPLQAGVAVGHLTRPIGISMAGYGARDPTNDTPWNDVLNGSRGMYGLPSVKAMVLEVEGERLVLLKLPTMSSESSLTDGIADKLQQKYGLELRGRILTGATHSHHTHARYWRLPKALAVVGCDSPDEEVIDELTTVFADTIKRAIDDLQPAHWGYAYRDDWDADNRIYRDRRGENNPTYGKDPRLTLLAVRRATGQPLAAIINFGMHGTVFGDENELLTEDAPGGIELKFEEYFYRQTGKPIYGMFIQAGGGDASPGGDHLGHPEAARTELVGEEAAPKIYDVYQQIVWRADASLGVRSQRIDLRYDDIGYDESDEFISPQNLPYTWGGWQCTGSGVDDANPDTSLEGKPKQCQDVEALLGALQQPIPHGEFHQTILTSAVIGDLVLVSLPGEPAASVIHYLREQLADRNRLGDPVTALAFGYSQDHLLYLTHPDDWYQGGYETEMSLWGPLFAKYIVDRQMATVDELLAGIDEPVWSEQSPNLSPPSDTPWAPRALEQSLDPGTVTTDPEPVVERGLTVRFGFRGGDATLAVPSVTLEYKLANGTYLPYPAASGWSGAMYDNSRYEMITHYSPDPAPNGEVVDSREHKWWVDWQVPLSFPATSVRFVARGEYFNGTVTSSYEVASPAFDIIQSTQASLSATLAGDDLLLTLQTAAPEVVEEESWLRAGFRLLDATAAAGAPQVVKAPLRIQFIKDGEPTGEQLTAEFDNEQGAHVIDFAATGLSPEGLSVSVHLAADISPSPVVVQVG